MNIILGCITLLLCLALLVGLVKPSLVLLWSRKPTRLKVLGFWFLTMLIISTLSALLISDEEIAKSNIEYANSMIKEQNYKAAISKLNEIDEENPFYNEAKKLIKEVDSLSVIKQRKIQVTKDLEEAKKKEEAKKELKEKLEREILSIDEGIDFSSYRGSVTLIQIELALFHVWSGYIKEALIHEDKEIHVLGKKLKSRLIKTQIKEFPQLRKNYREVIREKLWPENIETHIYGKGYSTIQFTGGVFASNKNKMEMQDMLREILTILRFKRVNYKWYKHDDEYTYYNLKPPLDSEILNLN